MNKNFGAIVFALMLLCIAAAVYLLVAPQKFDTQDRQALMVQSQEEVAERMKGGCPATVRRICKSPQSGMCEAVYISNKNSAACKKVDAGKIARICGDVNAELFLNDKSCLNLQPAGDCPMSLSEITEGDIEGLAQCPSLQKELCAKVCGDLYKDIDIRNAWQTDGEPAVICINNYNGSSRDPKTLKKDPNLQLCLNGVGDGIEIHGAAGGTRRWCVTYNKKLNGVDLGAYVQCVGQILP